MTVYNWLDYTAGSILISIFLWATTGFILKSKSKLCYDRRSLGQTVLE
jgi:hypothetical protein